VTINVRIKPDGNFLPDTIEKDPADVVDVVIDYTQYFKTDTITTVTVVGTNVTIDSDSLSANVVTLFISGGSDGTNGEIKLTVSSATVTIERTLIVRIENK
jgi:hypothetical protein